MHKNSSCTKTLYVVLAIKILDIHIPGNVYAGLYLSKLPPDDRVDPRTMTVMMIMTILTTAFGLPRTKDLSKVDSMTKWLKFVVNAWQL